MTRKFFLFFVLFLVCVFSVSGEVYVEDFNDGTINMDAWDFVNNTGACNITFAGGYMKMQTPADNGCFFVSKFNLTTYETLVVSWKMKTDTSGNNWQNQASLAITQPATDDSIYHPGYAGTGDGTCRQFSVTQATTPSGSWLHRYYNPTLLGVSLGSPGNTNWHTFIMYLQYGTLPRLLSYRDGVLYGNISLTSGDCSDIDDLKIVFGKDLVTGDKPHNIYFDSITIQGDIITDYPGDLVGCTFDESCLIDSSCIFRDTFSYDCLLSYMGYNIIPYNMTLRPIKSEFRYNADGFAEWSKDISSIFVQSPTLSFDLNITGNNTYQEIVLNQFDNTNSKTIPSVDLLFFDIGGVEYIGYISGGEAISLCTNCWTLGAEHRIEITLTNFDTQGRSYFNSTNGTPQKVLPQTYIIGINGVYYGNIPVSTMLNENHTITLKSVYMNYYHSSVIIDNLEIGIASGEGAGITTHEVYANLGEYCGNEISCISGLVCEYHRCIRKGTGATCTYGWECISRLCSNGYCSKPTTWDGIDASVEQHVGNDPKTLNLLSMAICITLFFAAVGLSKGALWGAIGGAVMLFTGLIFFTIVGWLSPFIMVGGFFIGILSLVVIIMLKG